MRNMLRNSNDSRRVFLRHAVRLAAAGAALPFANKAMASIPGARSLAFDHTHTGERISLIYAVDGQYLPDALMAFNHLRVVIQLLPGQVGYPWIR